MSTDTAYAPDAADLAAFDVIEHDAPAGVVTLHGLGNADTLAAGDDPALLVGIAVVKPGFYNGYFEVTRDDLDAWVARFAELATTFRPPFRLDHSWNVLNVIGRFVALRVENRADESIGGTVVPMLVGDVKLNGTKAENAQIREWIKSGKLDERSSEFYPYKTNAGAEYPSIFAGCAFVDIPAVEGLGAITLHRATLDRSSTDTPEGTTVSDTTAAPVTDDDVEVVDVDDLTADESATAAEDPAQDAPVIGDEPVVEEPAVEAEPVEVPAELAASLEAIGANLSAEQGAQLAAEIDRRVALRVEADTRIATFSEKGVIPLALRPQVESLLRHDDAAVRDGLAALLDFARPPVTLKGKVGVTDSQPSTDEAGAPTPAALKAMDFSDFTEAWAALTSAQRESPEYRAAYREQ